VDTGDASGQLACVEHGLLKNRRSFDLLFPLPRLRAVWVGAGNGAHNEEIKV
jgi:hypothetical protein